MSVAQVLKEHYAREKARLQGRALSHARMIKGATEIPEVARLLAPGRPASTNKVVRALDGKPMVFFTDGSLRHALGKRTTKAARKQLKRARRAQKSA